jgi:hypothetical protein
MNESSQNKIMFWFIDPKQGVLGNDFSCLGSNWQGK